MPDPNFTLKQWIARYNGIFSAEDEYNRPSQEFRAARFALTGLLPDGTTAHLDALSNRMKPTDAPPYIRRDFDSVIGFTQNIPVTCDLQFIPNSSPGRSLTKNIHILYTFNLQPNVTKAVDPASIPNIQFGTFGLRHQLRIFFPRLCNPVAKWERKVTLERQAEFYNQAIYPAAQHVLFDVVHGWPASHSAVEFKDRTTHGIRNSSYLIPSIRLAAFSARLRHIVMRSHDLRWARYFVWGTEIRGVKDANTHDIDANEAERAEVLDTLLRDLDTSQGDWWVDVGLEFCAEGRSLQWTTDHHPLAIQTVTGMAEQHIDRAMSNVRLYTKHIASHIMALSGFALTIPNSERNGGPLEVVYAQAYTTDKSQTYNPQQGRFGKAITGKMALSGNPPKFCQDLLNLYVDAGRITDVAARIELRVPLRYVPNAMTAVNWAHIAPCLVAFPRVMWWDFRATRLYAATMFLSDINSSSIKVRSYISTLTFVAGLVWLINGLHSAPDSTSTGRAVAKTVLPLTTDVHSPGCIHPPQNEDDQQDGVPHAPYGVMYLRPFFIPPESMYLRFDISRFITDAHFVNVFGCSVQDSALKLFKSGSLKRPRATEYVPQRKGNSRPRRILNDAVEEVLFPAFSEKEVPALGPDYGPEEDMNMFPAMATPITNVAQILTKIYFQFPSCVIQKIGSTKYTNTSGLSNYCPLAMNQREQITIDEYDTLLLGQFFVQVQWKRATEVEWNKTFNFLFPPKKHSMPRSAQHYNLMLYYRQYKELLNELEDHTAHEVRMDLWDKVKRLAWLPAADNSRVWWYHTDTDRFKGIPNPAIGGPRILVNPWAAGTPKINTEDDVIARREEEEESSEGEAV